MAIFFCQVRNIFCPHQALAHPKLGFLVFQLVEVGLNNTLSLSIPPVSFFSKIHARKKNNYNKILNEYDKQIKILNESKINKKSVTSGFGFSTLEFGIYKKLVLVQKQIHLHKFLFFCDSWLAIFWYQTHPELGCSSSKYKS